MSEFIQSIDNFYSNNTEISIAIVVALIVAVLINPRQIGKIVGAVVIIAVIAYVLASLGGTVSKGIDKKNEATTRTDKNYRESESK
jgi:Ca2+/Na+ antiporter